MKAIKVLILLVMLFLGFSLATQYVAYSLMYDSSLGRPLYNFWSIPFYSPWKLITWEFQFGSLNRDPFNTAWFIVIGLWAVSFVLFGAASGMRVSKQESITYGSARWASEKDIKAAGLYSGEGVVLGIDKQGRYLTDNGDRHVKVFAPTRSGKGVGIVIPTLLTWPESVLVFDPKGENWECTAGYRSKFSDVIYFNPTDLRSAHFNPLLEVRKGTSEVKDVQNIADMIVDPDGKGNTDHWAKTGHSLLVGAILHVLYAGKEKSLAGVAKLLSNPKMTIEETFEMMMQAPHLPDGSTHPQVAAAARDMLNKSFDERSGVLSTAMVTLAIYRDPIVAAVTADSDFMIDEFVNGKKPLSVYFVIPGSDISRLRPLFRLMINQFCRRLTETLEYERGETISLSSKSLIRRALHWSSIVPVSPTPTLRCKPRAHRVLFLLDEFPTLGRLEFFETTLAYIAQYGLKAMLISQCTNQLNKEYSDKNSITDNCHIRIVHAPNTIETAELISKMLGQRTEKKKHKNFGGSRFGFFLGHLTEGEHETPRPLLTPGEVMQLHEKDEIVFVSNKPPVRCKKLIYYEDDNFKWRLLPPPLLPSAGHYPYASRAGGNDWTPREAACDPDGLEVIGEEDGSKEAPFFVTGKRRKEKRPSATQNESQAKFFLDM